jgi:lathosterol oxidase
MPYVTSPAALPPLGWHRWSGPDGSEAHGGVCPGERWGAWPSAVGLTLGILAVLVGQVLVIAYHWVRLNWCATTRVQPEPRPYRFAEGVASHLGNPGGVIMMVAYLVGTWMLDIMPCSYYRFDGGVRWWMVALQLISQDALMYTAHMFEHKGPLGPRFYLVSHKPHHKFTNPRLFDAFDGSVPDTFTMILVPLALTAQLLRANVWEYMAFGSSWAGWLVLIHSETSHPWDWAFRRLGLGTAADHHVHHKTFKFNYGHTFMWWDILAGTYKSPHDVTAFTKSKNL